ncbi:LOW QUALITY PROTEIN: potassium channel regulatory protein, partial [Manis javanica]|uniref:LOW QUALITY PROTEIN: potassium channel regulatory protein n=1 Tax=Manis javanica TaxID=9974 RepID=UPI003C6CD48F
ICFLLDTVLDGRDQEFKTVCGQFFVDRDGVFSFILDFLRTQQLLVPADFLDYFRLQREALFYELDPLIDLLNQEHLLQPRPALMEVLFLSRNARAFFRVFGSCSKTIETLTGSVTVLTEHPPAPAWSRNFPPPQVTLLSLPPQRPSNHDLVFQCGSDGTTDSQSGVTYFVLGSLSLLYQFLMFPLETETLLCLKLFLERMIVQNNVLG